jgi:hypothetical protein
MLYLDVDVGVSVPVDIMDIITLYELDVETSEIVTHTKEKYPLVSEAYAKLSVALKDVGKAILDEKCKQLRAKKQEQQQKPYAV